MIPSLEARDTCYHCYRPKSSCMCEQVRPIETKTKFIILMHPKEFRKIKNGTGHLTHLSLPNSERYVGIDFSDHPRIKALIESEETACYLLYPSDKSIPLEHHRVDATGKTPVIFILDATWDCSRKMLRLSRNLQALPHLSFEHDKTSQFEIKTQPEAHCLSTIESTLCVLELLNAQGSETISEQALEQFLHPFKAMIAYQKGRIGGDGCSTTNSVRYKHPRKG